MSSLTAEFFDYGLDTIDFKTNLPKPVIKEYDGIKVVRDDLLDGGTKRRAFTVYVKSKPEIDEFVYASPRQGYAQLSLAYACKDLGKKCTVTIPQGERYWLSDAAEELGVSPRYFIEEFIVTGDSDVHEQDYLSVDTFNAVHGIYFEED